MKIHYMIENMYICNHFNEIRVMDEQKNVIIADSLQHVQGDNYSFYCNADCYSRYLVHALCTGGSCRFAFNGREFDLHEGDSSPAYFSRYVQRNLGVNPTEYRK